jgi:hypothetical protein
MLTNKMILPLLGTRVADMVGRNNTWKWEDFAHLLPIRVLMVIASHPVPSTMMGTNNMYWKSSFSGQFTIKTTYN